MPRKLPDDDFDFKIFVDPSCLSAPIEDEPTTNTNTAQPMATEQIADVILPDPVAVKESSAVTVEDIDLPQATQLDDVVVDKEEEEPPLPVAEEGALHIPIDDQHNDSIPEPTEHKEEEPDTSVLEEDTSHISVDHQQDQSTAEPEPPSEIDHEEEELLQRKTEVKDNEQEASIAEEISVLESEAAPEQGETHEEEADTGEITDTADTELQVEEQDLSINEDHPYVDEENEVEVSEAEQLGVSFGDTSEVLNHPGVAEDEHDQPDNVADRSFQEDDAELEDAETPKAHNLDTEHDIERSFPALAFSDRKTSLRTEALIQAAARAVVARIERRQASGDFIRQEDEEEEQGDHSILSTGAQESVGVSETQSTYDGHKSPGRRQSSNSTGSELHHRAVSPTASGDEGGESSSHHEAESDDVFSDRSARSSIASFDVADDLTLKSPLVHEQFDRQSVRSNTRSPRMSGVSLISDLSQYDKEDFVPTSRDTRIPFRTPSAIRNIQMSSPTPSVINGGSPRSSKRQAGSHTGGILPTISRLGSPNVSTQFSPKGRSTPTRFKSRKDTPLVLLHVTLLPLRWMWGDILNGLDAVNGKTFGENQQQFEASEQLKTLRDSWRELQDRVGDTVFERGVLLPHPQNDYEVLEERLLEALELSLRRRARILECGHYLGPSNEFPDEDESEDECVSQSGQTKEAKRHWCNTCRGEIRYEDLGPGKAFRVQVYASNGLMRAGAWAACWKEMERVDIEVEPIVEPSVQGELEQLATAQMELEEQRQRDAEREAEAEAERELEAEAEREAAHQAAHEEAELPSLEPDRRRSAATPYYEDSFVEDQTLPIPTDQERLYLEPQEQRPSSAAVLSSPPPAAMQITMHASPLQPPSAISTIRFTSPSPQMTPFPVLRPPLSEPMDISEDRMRRDEERLREIYGETPLPIEPAEATSSMHAQPTSSRPPHPDSYIPPAIPRSPSEEAYERRARRESNNRQYDNASFIELLLEAFKVLLRDPKNVAIIVLCLFMMAILTRPSSQVPANSFGAGHDQLGYRYDVKAEVVMDAPVVAVQADASVVHEAVVFTTTSAEVVEASLVSTPLLEVEPSVPSAVESEVLEASLVSTPFPEAESSVPSAVESEVLKASLVSTPLLEVEPSAPSVLETVVEVIDGPDIEVEADTSTALAEEMTENASNNPEAPEMEGSEEVEVGTSAALPEEISENLSNNSEVLEMEGPEEVVADASFVDEPVILPQEETVQILSNVEDVTDVTEESSFEVDTESSAHFQAILPDDPDNVLDAPPAEDEVMAEEAISEQGPQTGSNDMELPSIATATATATATAAEEPCSTLTINQRTTLRVYETITETVTVHAVTAEQTETASITETAVPQTVEETVYETETVRVTVSVVMGGEHDEL